MNYSYDETKIFENFNFSIKKGEFLMILGKNGSGKSTLAKLISGIIVPDTGKILIDNLNTNTEEIWEIRKKMGVIFQNPEDQFVGTTPLEEMTFILENYDQENIEEKIDHVLKIVDLMDKKYDLIDNFSGGQQQKLALATTLLLNPEILILDEASAMLDPQSRTELLGLLKKLNNNGVTIVYITHYLEEITYSSLCLILDQGKVIMEESPSIILGKDLLKYSLIIPFHLKLIMKLNKGNNKFLLENSHSVVNQICQLL